MAATIQATKDEARDVIANGMHFTVNAYVSEFGRRVRNSEIFDGKSFGFFFAADDAAADDRVRRVAKAENRPYRVVGVVCGRDVEADMLGYIAQ